MGTATIKWIEGKQFVGIDSTRHSVVLSTPDEGVGIKPSDLLLIAVASCTAVDVVEIDAASNNGVDNVRDIVEAVKYRPARDRFKVFVVDEVHMLSTGAFNALLKTLEEPPPRVKFIFATTDAQKVPITVLSRCQRFLSFAL